MNFLDRVMAKAEVIKESQKLIDRLYPTGMGYVLIMENIKANIGDRLSTEDIISVLDISANYYNSKTKEL